MLNSKEIKPVALAIIELHLSKGISQSNPVQPSAVQPVRKFCLKFHINLVEGFMVDLITFLGLAMPA